jgi:signal peptidase I
MAENIAPDGGSKHGKLKRVISIIGSVLAVLIFVFVVYAVINVFVAKKNNKPANFFGYSFAIVLTESMEPEIMTGDLIIFKSCNFDDIQIGDDIVFVAGDGFGEINGQCVVHRVISEENGRLFTQGVNNSVADIDAVTKDNFLGICIYNSAILGKIFTFFSKYGIILIVAIVLVPFIINQVIKICKLAKHGDGSDNDNSDDSKSD